MKNKKVLISSVILGILILAMILSILYFTTDLFKTNQQLFYKYISKAEIIDFNFIKQIELANQRIANNSNSSLGNLDITSSIINQQTGIADVQKLLNVKSNGLENVLSKQSYRDFVFSNNEQNFLTLKYIRDDNTYAIGADNILAKYLAVENANLKDLYLKLGVHDVSQVPNSISPISYEEILKIDEVTLEQLKETYSTLIYNNISKKNFYKTKNQDKTETIGVSLSEQDSINIIKVFLETIKNDNTLLNLFITKSEKLGYGSINIEMIQKLLQETIDEINSNNNDYSTDKDFIKLSFVKKEKKVIKYQIEINYEEEKNNYGGSTFEKVEPLVEKNKIYIELDFSSPNTIKMIVKENDLELDKTMLNYKYNDTNINIDIQRNIITNDEESYYMKMQFQTNNYQSDNITQNVIINVGNDKDGSVQINLSNNISLKQDIQISKLTTENSAKLNDMTSEELNQLFEALGNRINQLYGSSLNNVYENNALEAAKNAQLQYEKELKKEEQSY